MAEEEALPVLEAELAQALEDACDALRAGGRASQAAEEKARCAGTR